MKASTWRTPIPTSGTLWSSPVSVRTASPATARRAAVGVAGLAGLLTTAVTLTRHTRHSWTVLARPGATPEDYLVTGVGIIAVGLTGWLSVGVTLGVLALLPGVAGRAASALTRRVMPEIVRRWTTLLLSVLLSSATGVGGCVAGTATAAASQTWPASMAWPNPGWPDPSSPDPSGPDPSSADPSRPDPGWPEPSWRDLNAAPARGAPWRPRDVGHTVAAGDCLWSIARANLPARASNLSIDREWRRWYARNRSMVGADPNLIHPGQRLRAPGGPPLHTERAVSGVRPVAPPTTWDQR